MLWPFSLSINPHRLPGRMGEQSATSDKKHSGNIIVFSPLARMVSAQARTVKSSQGQHNLRGENAFLALPVYKAAVLLGDFINAHKPEAVTVFIFCG